MNGRAWLLFGVVSVLWGIPYLFIEIALREGFGPITTAAGRVVLAAIVLLPITASPGARQLIRGRFGQLTMLALIEVVIPFSMISLGELTVSSAVAGIIIATEPIFVLVITLVLG
jgi:drug/metabolite transporter (DMT)-like permease